MTKNIFVAPSQLCFCLLVYYYMRANTDHYKRLEERLTRQSIARQTLLAKAFKANQPTSALEPFLVLLAIGVILGGLLTDINLKTTPKVCQERPGTGTLKEPIIGAFKPCQIQVIGKTRP